MLCVLQRRITTRALWRLVMAAAAMGILFNLARGQENLDDESEYCDFSSQSHDDGDPDTLWQWSGCCDDEDGDDDGPLVTDRPGFTTSPSTVGRGVWQFELGYSFTSDDDGVTETLSHSYPQLLVRIGLFADWFEIRLEQDCASETVTAGGVSDSANGAQDLLLGCKIALTEQCGWLPQMTLLPQTTVPTGSEPFTFGEMLPGLGWLYAWDITDNLSLDGNTLGNRYIDDTGHAFTLFAQSLNATYQFTDPLSGFVEWYAFFPSSAVASDISPEHYFDGGFTYLLNDNLQLDVSAGVGLNDAADDYFVGAGLSLRL